MAGPASPIDITTPTRHTSSSPASHNKTSNLTSALQGAAAHDAGSNGAMNIGSSSNNGYGMSSGAGRHESLSGAMSGFGSQWGGEARPISMKNPNRDKPRRESVAGSVVGGMSWGGVSVGSWIRDDIIMAGTSPFAYQTPSYHSSSYLPKLEANFMRDFSCCGITLPSLHDLLQHYEESHAQQQAPSQSGPSGQGNATPDSKAAIAAGAAAAVQQQAQQQEKKDSRPSEQQSQAFKLNHNTVPAGGTPSMSGFQMMHNNPQGQNEGFGKSSVQPAQDMDAVEDMEMDDDLGDQNGKTPPSTGQNHLHSNQQTQFGRQPRPMGSAVPPLNLSKSNLTSQMQNHQGLRTSQPATPGSSTRHGFPLQTNPTVSSVNTPTLSAQPLQQQRAPQTSFSPDSSVPGTPAEIDPDFVGNLPSEMAMPGNNMFNQNNMFGLNMGGNQNMLDLCIDEPAKRLFSKNGGLNNQHYAQFGTGSGQVVNNSELAMKIREQQLLSGMGANNVGMMPGEEAKPFRCPVIGCEKAYKNQNGLKYHKTHGHTNQQLHENADGTFSIVNPETSVPYPGTLGMEKEKPYQCETCGKRYKNLNGLKYHKAHSTPCNPDLKLGGGAKPPTGPNALGMGLNMQGSGLAGIGEEAIVQ
ncbi:MAG: Transcriptional regulator of ribosomal biogenesis proteins [Piccolia ochrophora]|nr:MAG: Transcriptional regulator of ribosomal biogenesis proteins [Piccolia ochrophora]